MIPTWARHHLIVMTASMVVLFTNLGGPRLWDRDEPRNAGCAAEMLERNDWVVPVFNGELRTHKPVLLYWLTMTAYAVFGIGEFGARFWSAALGVATVVMTYHMGRKLFDAQAGLWGALALTTSLMFVIAGRAATPDSVLIFTSTLALFAFVMLSIDKTTIAWRHAVPIYAAMGLAILAKGPVGLVLPTAIIGMYLLIMRLPEESTTFNNRWLSWLNTLGRPFAPLHFLRTCWAMRPLTALGVSLAVALPWYVWVDYRTGGAWTEGFFWEHNLNRATQSMEGHRGNLLFYPVALAIGLFPWSIFLAPLLLDTVQQLRQRSKWMQGYIFAACWVCVFVGVFSIAKTKLPSYITPCYPGAALLIGAFISRVAQRQVTFSMRWLQLASAVSTVVGVVLLIALPLVANKILPGEEWVALAGIIPLSAGVLGWFFIRRDEYHRLPASYAVAAVLFSTALFAFIPQRVDSHQQNNELLATIYENSPDPEIGHFRYLEPTWVFYAARPLTNVTAPGDPQPKTQEVSPTETPRMWERKTKVPMGEFLAANPNRFVITTRAAWDETRSQAPADVEVLTEVPYFLKKASLVVVGRRRGAEISTADLAIPSRLRR